MVPTALCCRADASAGIPLQKRLAIAAGLGAGGLVMVYANDTTQLQFDTATATGSLLSLLDAETAHRVGIWAAKYRLVPRDSRPDPPSLATTVWGRHFVNPLGEPNPQTLKFGCIWSTFSTAP